MHPRLSLVSFALALGVISIDSYVSEAGVNYASEEETILKVVEQYVEAYNRRDVNAITALFDKDADIVTLVAVYRGLEEIERFFKSSVAKEGTITLSRARSDSIRFLRPEVAIVDVSCEITGMLSHNGEVMPRLHRMGTFLLVKNGGCWFFSAMRLRTFTIGQRE
jgi:uncharacterized protein (TIGR02246 family)